MLEALLELVLVCILGSRFVSPLGASVEIEPKLTEERTLELMLGLEEVSLSIVKNGNQNLIVDVELG